DAASFVRLAMHSARSSRHNSAGGYGPIGRPQSRALGLCDVYLGIDWQTERGGEHTSRLAQSVELDAERLPADARRCGSTENAIQLRCLRLGIFLAPPHRGAAGARCS